MAESGELDFSNLDGMDDIDWSDVEGELQQNREMLIKEAEDKKGGGGGMDADFAGEMTAVAESEPSGEVNIDFLLDIPLKLTVEVGRAKLMIKDLLNLDINSIVELRKKVGAPMDVRINDKLVAKGEIIVQNEKFGLKLTEILDEQDRLKSLK